jgi:hypothetical protein
MAAWLHYIGGNYTPRRFVIEARKHGVSRRIPARLLKSISWGDKVYCATWEGSLSSLSKNGINIMEGFGGESKGVGKFQEGRAEIFAMFTIDRIVIEDREINVAVQRRLREQGLIKEVHDSPGKMVRRACGYYVESGSIIVSERTTIAQIAEIAFEIAAGQRFNVMIQGRLRKVYAPPRALAAPFTRGLMRIEDLDQDVIDISGDHALVEVTSHVVARKKDDFAVGSLL